MPIDYRLMDIVGLKPTKTEAKLLETLDQIEFGNAYQIWKKSSMKNYPTVLRSLKRLQERGFAGKVARGGPRGETVYSCTIQGRLMLYIFYDKMESAINLAENNSNLFGKIKGASIEKDVLMEATSKFILASQKKRSVNFKDYLGTAIDDTISMYVFEFAYNDEKHEVLLRQLAKTPEIKSLILDRIATEKSDVAKAISKLDRLQINLCN